MFVRNSTPADLSQHLQIQLSSVMRWLVLNMRCVHTHVCPQSTDLPSSLNKFAIIPRDEPIFSALATWCVNASDANASVARGSCVFHQGETKQNTILGGTCEAYISGCVHASATSGVDGRLLCPRTADTNTQSRVPYNKGSFCCSGL